MFANIVSVDYDTNINSVFVMRNTNIYVEIYTACQKKGVKKSVFAEQYIRCVADPLLCTLNFSLCTRKGNPPALELKFLGRSEYYPSNIPLYGVSISKLKEVIL